MFKHAIVRVPATTVIDGITTADEGKPIYGKALAQHEAYVSALTKTGVDVTVLAPQDDFPDSCFVEDVALCTPHCAIITRPGAATRQQEAALDDMALTLRQYYDHVEQIEAPGTVEAGDIMMVGDHYYIGQSARTNAEGARQLISILEKYGMSGETVPVKEVLHLKTGVTYLDNNNLVVSGEFIDDPRFDQFNKIVVDPDEAYGVNTILMNNYVLVAAGYPKVQKKIEDLGYQTLPVEMSEFRKIDGGLTCLSLRF